MSVLYWYWFSYSEAYSHFLAELAKHALPFFDTRVRAAAKWYLAGTEDEVFAIWQADPELIIHAWCRSLLCCVNRGAWVRPAIGEAHRLYLVRFQINRSFANSWFTDVIVAQNTIATNCHISLVIEYKTFLAKISTHQYRVTVIRWLFLSLCRSWLLHLFLREVCVCWSRATEVGCRLLAVTALRCQWAHHGTWRLADWWTLDLKQRLPVIRSGEAIRHIGLL